MFSLSSHETQVQPSEGSQLFQHLKPDAILISAYDAWQYYKRKSKYKYFKRFAKLKNLESGLFLDSGNYEAYRKHDRRSKNNKDGWHCNLFRHMASELSPDMAFAFDNVYPTGGADEIAQHIVNNFRADEYAINPKDFPLCPIIHLPKNHKSTLADLASQIIVKVASNLNPIMIAIPERELGNGLKERINTVQNIRKALNNLGKYYPLHLLGTGNPLSIVALSVAGADSFDGLEWCRTVVDYGSGHLFHFQHFDIFRDGNLWRLQPIIRKFIEQPNASYNFQVLSYNFDYFTDLMNDVRKSISSGNVDPLLKFIIPSIDSKLIKELKK